MNDKDDEHLFLNIQNGQRSNSNSGPIHLRSDPARSIDNELDQMLKDPFDILSQVKTVIWFYPMQLPIYNPTYLKALNIDKYSNLHKI